MVALAPPQRTLDQVVSFSQQDFEAVNRNLSVNNSGWMDRACPKEMRVSVALCGVFVQPPSVNQFIWSFPASYTGCDSWLAL